MPTDVSRPLSRQDEAKAGAESNATVLLFLFILCLLNLALIFISPTFANAVALAGQY